MPVFDASVVIGLQRKDPRAVALTKEQTGSVAIPAVAWMEVLAGFRPAKQGSLDAALRDMGSFVPLSRDIVLRASALQSALMDAGRRVDWNDLQVAATALHLGEPLVTLDDGFEDIPGLRVLRP